MEADTNTELLFKRINELSHRCVRLNEQFDEKKFQRIKDLTKIEISVLNLLYENPKIIMRDISETLMVSKSMVTGIIDRLEELGFLRRVISKQDRRSYSLEITEEGKLAQLEHLELEKFFYLLIIEAMRAGGITETYLDQTEIILNYLEQKVSLT